MTEAEKRLWRFLRAGQLDGHKFRRQVGIGPYVVDFICLSQKLIIELDGPQHQEQVRRNMMRSGRLAMTAAIAYFDFRIMNWMTKSTQWLSNSGRVEVAAPTPPHPPSPALPSRGREPEGING